MTHRILSEAMIRNLIKKADDSLPKLRPLFDELEMKKIRDAVKGMKHSVTLRGRMFVFNYHAHRGESWVRMNPTDGYTPMFNAPVKWVLDPEKEV